MGIKTNNRGSGGLRLRFMLTMGAIAFSACGEATIDGEGGINPGVAALDSDGYDEHSTDCDDDSDLGPDDLNGGGECPDPDDPGVHYIGDSAENPELCWVINFACDEDQTAFTDECGCGCIDAEPEPQPEPDACPDPDDPAVHYIGDSHQNPQMCGVITFGCSEGQELFTNECGCGCIDGEPEPEPEPEPDACPDPDDPRRPLHRRFSPEPPDVWRDYVRM